MVPPPPPRLEALHDLRPEHESNPEQEPGLVADVDMEEEEE